MALKWLTSAFALSAALLWVFLVPLWDGFDEAQHYSYIQSLAIEKSFPIMGKTLLTPEVWASLLRSPVSPAVQVNYPMLRTFGQARSGTQPRIDSIPAPPNYEAHQAPLAYLILLPFERIMRSVPLVRFTLLAVSMLAFLRVASFSCHPAAAWFMVLATEIFLATCGHVANDGIAIPLFVWLFFECEKRNRLAVVLFIAGLLTKAYFLALVPIVIWKLRARWRFMSTLAILPLAWYGRNLVLYGSLSGMQEQITPLPAVDLLHGALTLPWAASFGQTFRGALWLANNSFLQWSVWQVNVIMAILILALCVGLHADKQRRNWFLAYAGSYTLALAFAAVQSFVYSKGGATSASPWYATPLWLLVIQVIFASDIAAWVLASLTAIWTYWFIATFWLRLIPWYAGVMNGPATLSNLHRWYISAFAQTRSGIGDPVLILAFISTALAIVTAVAICRDLLNPSEAYK